MSRGGYKGRENYPHTFSVCPGCGKKGLYERSYLGDHRYASREKRCKYCHYGETIFEGDYKKFLEKGDI